MEQVALKASVRQGVGKEKAKKLRKEGFVPGVVYHRGEESVSVTVNEKELSRLLRTAGGDNVLINLSIEGSKKKARAVLIKELQHHPVKRSILHVDFNEISLSEKIIVEVEVESTGESIGVKQEGGILDHPLRVVKIQCLPTDIPKHFTVDVTGLKLNQAFHVSELVVSDKIKILTDPDAVLFTVKAMAEEKVDDLTAAAPEIEVIREKKDEEGKAGAAPAKDEKKEAPKAADKK
jgi:large subunit ribosomal protein L25